MDAALKEALDRQATAFEAFKKSNDERLAKLEKGSSDPLVNSAVDKANAEIAELQKQIQALSAKAGRPGGAANDNQEDDQKARHAKAFEHWMRTNDPSRLKAVNVGTDSAGGYAVPEDLERGVLERERLRSPMRAFCKQMTVTNETFEQLVNLGGAASGWVGETAPRPETTAPTLASIKPHFGEVYANPASTQKALDDMMFDVEAWLQGEVARTFAEAENLAFTSGNGVNKPKGILDYTLTATGDSSRSFGQIEKVHSGVSGTFVPDRMIDLIHRMKPGHRLAGKWMMSTLAVAEVRKLKDDNGNYLWMAGIQAGQPSTLLGYPIIENENMPAVAADANAAIFADFESAYLIADIKGFRVLRDDLTNKPYVHFYSTKRVGGGVVNDQAVKVYTLSA